MHRIAVGELCNASVAWDQQAVKALDREFDIGLRAMDRRAKEELRDREHAERRAKREAKAKVVQAAEVEAQKEAARQLANRGRGGKGRKRKRRK